MVWVACALSAQPCAGFCHSTSGKLENMFCGGDIPCYTTIQKKKTVGFGFFLFKKKMQ